MKISMGSGLALAVMMMAQAALGVEIVAHRGASHDAPENTIAAYRLAWEQKADAIESDWWLTKDGKIIDSHDADTKRTTGVAGKIPQMTFDALRKLDAGKWKGPQFAGEKLPSLSEVLGLVPAGKKVLLEVKCGPEIVPLMKKQISESKLRPEQIRIISFNEDVVRAAKAAMPEIKAYWLFNYKKAKDGTWNATPEQVLAKLKATNADGLDIGFTEPVLGFIDEAFARKLRSEKMEFHVWTVDDPKLAKRAAELGVDSITTNRPAFIREQLGTPVAGK